MSRGRTRLGRCSTGVASAAAALAALVSSGCGSARSAPATTAPPAPRPFRIVFPEGFTRLQMAERVRVVARIAERERHEPVRLGERAYLLASQRGRVPCFGRAERRDLEGFLFPATYDFLPETTARALVAAQIAAFCREWRSVDLAYAASRNLTPYDVLKIASMVEAEAAVPGDRALVAAVIYNRLRAGMQLGIDATLRYGLHIPPTQSITESELHDPTPYNTRLHYGLPPTPIDNPGLASIEAAAHPARLGYLYYARVPGTKRHRFFESAAAYDRYLTAHGYGPH